MFGDLEAQNSLSHMSMRAPRLRYPSVPVPVGKERWKGKLGGRSVVEQPEALWVQDRALFDPEPTRDIRAMSHCVFPGQNSNT